MRAWYEPLRPLCETAAAPLPVRHDVVLFYLARWCQKKGQTRQPLIGSFDQGKLRETAEAIARHLADDGARIDVLVTNESGPLWTEVRRALYASARSRVPDAAAYEFAGEAMSKIAEVLLIGTPPSLAAAQLEAGPDGANNEYVFDSPFSNWASTIVINLIRDEWRRQARRSRAGARSSANPKRELVERAREVLPHLLDAVRELPPKQRAVMVLTLNRRGLDADIRRRLRKLAPDLFRDAGPLVSSDADIAERLGSIPRRITANRSAARRKLAKQDRAWELLLDLMLPHRSTRPVHVEREG